MTPISVSICLFRRSLSSAAASWTACSWLALYPALVPSTILGALGTGGAGGTMCEAMRGTGGAGVGDSTPGAVVPPHGGAGGGGGANADDNVNGYRDAAEERSMGG